MLRSELVAKLVSKRPDLRPAAVEMMLDALFDEITIALKRGDRVELRGFGAFSVRRRRARIGRNPRTGEKVDVPDKAVPFFKPGKELRETVNNGTDPGED